MATRWPGSRDYGAAAHGALRVRARQLRAAVAGHRTGANHAIPEAAGQATTAYVDAQGNYDLDQDPLYNGMYEPGLGSDGEPPEPLTNIHYYQCDHLGTPMELTDEDGNIAWEANYRAWGEARLTISEAARKAGLKNPIRFQGQYLDEETGLHYNRFRYYDPVAGEVRIERSHWVARWI
jgi:hypothetical protein